VVRTGCIAYGKVQAKVERDSLEEGGREGEGEGERERADRAERVQGRVTGRRS